VGYSVDHANDVYRMFNFNTKRIIYSRDVVWLGKSYKNWMINNVPSKGEYDDDDDDDEYVHTIATINQEANNPERCNMRTAKNKRKHISEV
jgi:predicted ATP-grasp superfamily ATP-dependent carboligase